MITVRMDRRVLYGILGVVAVLVVLGLGFALGKAVNPSSSAQVAASQSASQSASQAQKAAQPAVPTPQYDPTAIAAANAQLAHVPRMNLDDAKQKLTDPNVLFVDARSAQEFAQGHIKGAVSVPVNEVDKYLSRIPQDKEIIVYCA